MKMKALRLLPLTLLLGMGMAMAQVNFTQTTTSDFMQGTGLNVNIANDCVSLQGKMASLADWGATTNMPQTLKNHQIALWHDYIYLVGGNSGSAAVNTVYRATQQSLGISSWTTLSNLPEALQDMAVVATQTRLYVLGGRNGIGVSDKIYSATLNSNGSIGSWTLSETTLPQPCWGGRAVMVMGNIYLIGGAATDNTNDATDKVYCLKLDAWGEIGSITEVTAMPAARNGHAVATYDSKIFVTGGYDATYTAQNTVFAATVNLDGSLGSWTTTSLPVAVYDHGLACSNGVLVIIGGYDSSLSLPSNKCFYAYLDDPTLQWTQSDIVLPERYTQGTAFAFGDKMFYCGGQTISNALNSYVRFMVVTTSDQMVKKASFVGLPFDVGAPKTMQQLDYTLNYTSSTTSYEILYRLAGSDKVFGNWISAGSNLPVALNVDYSYIQYMFRFTANGSDNLSLEDVTLTLSGLSQLAGNLNDISTLSLEGSPYLVTGDISFTSGSHTIEAGVVIEFMPNTGMNIGQASMNFAGTEENPILLTSNGGETGMWNGVYFQDASDNGVTSSMNYTTIEKAGNGNNNANLYLENTNQPVISHCSFNQSSTNGMRLQNSAPSISESTMDGNTLGGIYYSSTNFNASMVNVTCSNNEYGIWSCTPNRSFTYDGSDVTFENNVSDIAVSAGQISSDQTWNLFANGYALLGTVQIYGGTPKLTIAPGNTIKVKSGYYIYVGNGSSQGGMLYAVGTANAPITFTSYDGNIGGWAGLYFRDGSDYNSSSSLRYCFIEKAVNNITCASTNQPSIMWSTIQDASNAAVNLSSSNINIEECFIKNSTYGIYSTSSQPTLISDVIEGMLQACIWYNDNNNDPVFYNCILKDSYFGIHYSTPNRTINNDNNVVFQNNDYNKAIPGGTISTNIEWASNTYAVLGSLLVGIGGYNYSGSDYSRLTIAAGSTLSFEAGSNIQISKYYSTYSNYTTTYYRWYGELYAIGKEEAPITFTSMNGEIGGWEGMYFHDYSDSFSGMESSLKYCIIEKGNDYNLYMGSTNQPNQIENCIFREAVNRGANFSSSTTNLTNCQFLNNGGDGIYFGSSGTILNNCQVNGNGGYGIYSANSLIELHNGQVADNDNYAMYYDNIHYVDVLDASFSGNLVDGVRIAGGRMTESRNWNIHDYYIFNNVIIGRDNTPCRLTLLPGTTLKFAEGAQMKVSEYYYYNNNNTHTWYGELNAIGTVETPITFTSMNGETGGWNGLFFDNPSDNISGMESVLKYCIIEKGNDYNMNMSSTSQPAQIENCIFRDAMGDGVYLHSSGTPTLQSCQMLNNGNYGMRLYNTSPVVKKTTIKGNASYGLYLDGNSSPTVGGNYTNGCSIYRNNGGYQVYQNGSANINMPYNFFGSIDSVYIDSTLVFDKKEDNSKGRINIKPNSWLPVNTEAFDWSGHLYYDGNTSKPMANQTMDIKDYQGNVLESVSTNSQGYFNFSNLDLGVASLLDLSINIGTDLPWNSTDALLAMRHYTQQQLLEGAQLRAADVNLSNSVNGTDALLIQRRFLGNPFPAGDVQITGEAFNHTGNDLAGDLNVLLFGDVNGSYNPSRDGGVLLLNEGELLVESHQTIDLPVVIKNFNELGAVSLMFNYPEEYLEMETVTMATELGHFLYYANEGRLGISWYDISPLLLDNDEMLLNIRVTTRDLSMLDEPIVFGLEACSEMADGQGIAINDAIIAMPSVITETLDVEETTTEIAFAVTVYPNPMSDKAKITYCLPAEGSVTLTVYNIMGNVTATLVNGRQEAGLHQVELNSRQWASGVYYCCFTCGNQVKVIKMVVE